MIHLEDIIDIAEPNGTFHDADVLSISVDYQQSVLKMQMLLCVGDPNANSEAERERRRLCEIAFEGLRHWSIGLPSPDSYEINGSLWMTSDGPLKDCPTEDAKKLNKANFPHDIQWYFYFSDINTFAYLVANKVFFRWISL